MRTLIHFQGFEAFEHHFEFVNNLVKSSINKFDIYNKFTTRIKLKELKSKHKYSNNRFECEISIVGDKKKGDMFFKKSSVDFYESVRMTTRAAEKSLRRESKTRTARKRKNIISAQQFKNLEQTA